MVKDPQQPGSVQTKLFLLKWVSDDGDTEIIENPHDGDHVPRVFNAVGCVCPATAFAHGELFPPTTAPPIVGKPDPAPGQRWNLNFAIPVGDTRYPDGAYKLRVTPVTSTGGSITGATVDEINLNVP